MGTRRGPLARRPGGSPAPRSSGTEFRTSMSNQLFLLKELVKRDFVGRYVGSALGFLWPFILPVWQLLLFTFVFSTVMRIPLVGQRTESFSIFLFAGLLPWMAVQEGIQRSATAITDHANMIKSSQFRTEILVLSLVIGALVQEAIAAVIFAAVLAYNGQLALGGLPLLLVALPLQIALTLGLGLLTCCLHTLFRDMGQIVPLLMMGWFYLTPVVYPITLVPEKYRNWIEWNPLATLVELYRQAFLSSEPTLLAGTGRLALVGVVLLVAGLWLFARLQASFADEI